MKEADMLTDVALIGALLLTIVLLSWWIYRVYRDAPDWRPIDSLPEDIPVLVKWDTQPEWPPQTAMRDGNIIGAINPSPVLAELHPCPTHWIRPLDWHP
jgi:hypothetical protein